VIFFKSVFVFLCIVFLNLSYIKPVDNDCLKYLAESEGYGYKTANLKILSSFVDNKQKNKESKFNVIIPDFIGISSFEIKTLLKNYGFDFDKKWKKIVDQHLSKKNLSQVLKKKHLPKSLLKSIKKLSYKLSNVFDKIKKNKSFCFSSNIQNFICKSNAQKCRLMVRSTGKEDTSSIANAGGNLSAANVSPNHKEIVAAIVNVVASYIDEKSLQQRVSAGDTTIFEVPMLPVLLQQMICEYPSNTKPDNIPVGCVIYSQEPLGNTDGVVMIQSTFGHPEGVVESSIPVDTFYVGKSNTIHKTIRNKNYRIVHSRSNGNVKITHKINPKVIQKKASLEADVLFFLKDLALQIHNFYGCPMDLELIYNPKEKTVYLVQARPIVLLKNGSLASYINNIDSIKQNLKTSCSLVVNANGGVKKIIDDKQIIFAKTLDKALEIYNLKARGKAKVQAIVVEKNAEPTSHAAAVFRGEGKTIIICNEKKKVENWLNSGSGFFIDSQQGYIVSTKSKNLKKAPGFINHPIPMKVSVDENIESSDSFICDRRTNKFVSCSYEQIIEKFKLAKTLDGTKDIASSLLQKVNLQQSELAGKSLETDFQHLKNQYRETCKKLTILKHNICACLKEIMDSTKYQQSRMERLYPIRFLEALLLQDERLEFENMYSMKSVIERLQNEVGFFEKHFAPAIKRGVLNDLLFHDARIVELAKSGICAATTKKLSIEWLEFLNQLAVEAQSCDRNRLIEITSDLRTLGSFEAWINSSFSHNQKTAMEKSGKSNHKNLLDLICKERAEIKKMLDLLKRCNQSISQISLTEDTNEQIFEQVIAKFETTVFSILFSCEFQTILHKCESKQNYLLKVAVISTLQKIVNTYDSFLKSIKSSSLYLSQKFKVKILRKALWPYLKLLKTLGISKPLESVFDSILKRKFCNKSELYPSFGFNVGSVIEANIQPYKTTKQELQHTIITLEDAFTSIHQLLLSRLSSFFIEWRVLETIEVPQLVRSIQQILCLKKSLVGINFCEQSTVFQHNKILRAHSIQLNIEYRPLSEDANLEINFYGENEFMRWSILRDFIAAASSILELELLDMNKDSCRMSFSWRITQSTNLELVNFLLEESIQTTLLLGVENEETIYEKIKKVLEILFEHLIKSTSSQEQVMAILLEREKQSEHFNMMLIPAIKFIDPSDPRLDMIFSQALDKAEKILENTEFDYYFVLVHILEQMFEKIKIKHLKSNKKLDHKKIKILKKHKTNPTKKSLAKLISNSEKLLCS
jgi:hypothetical protein